MSLASRPFPTLPEPLRLSQPEERCLGELAARAIKDCVRGAQEDSAEKIAEFAKAAGGIGEIPPRLGECVGVFVTLFTHGEDLRGCLGTAEGREPLYLAVPRLARATASRDYRFSPLEGHELPSLSVEISILGALTRLPADPAELLLGLNPQIHGVYLHAEGRSGLLLPQVAQRLGWGAQELLEQVSLKAGLSRGAWRTGEILGFTAHGFEVVKTGDLSIE